MLGQPWTPLRLLQQLQQLEDGALSGKRTTMTLEVFTSTCLSLSRTNFVPGELTSLMSEAITQMWSLPAAVLNADTTTLSKMVWSLEEISSGRAEEEIVRLKNDGLQSFKQRVWKNFGVFSRCWILSAWLATSQRCSAMPIGSGGWNQQHMKRHLESLKSVVSQSWENGNYSWVLLAPVRVHAQVAPPPLRGDPRALLISQRNGLLCSRVRATLTSLGRKQSLVLWGPTRTGKTVWSRSLGPHLYFCGLYSYKEAKKAADATYAIFDDIQGGIKFFPAFKNWLGSQYQFQIKGLYRDPELITWGKPSIWVANTDPREDMSPADIEWLEGNCTFVNVTTAIFHANTQ